MYVFFYKVIQTDILGSKLMEDSKPVIVSQILKARHSHRFNYTDQGSKQS